MQDLKNGQKLGRDERMQDYPTSAVYFYRCRVVFLRSFISALFLSIFSGPSLTEIKFYRNFFPSYLNDGNAGPVNVVSGTDNIN